MMMNTTPGWNGMARQADGYKGNLLLITGCLLRLIDSYRYDQGSRQEISQHQDTGYSTWRLEPAEVADRYGELSTKYKQIDAVYTADDDMMLGAMQAYKESGEKT